MGGRGQDTAGAAMPLHPALIFVLTAIAAALVHRRFPVPLGLPSWGEYVGIAVLVVAVVTIGLAYWGLGRRGTDVDPGRPSTALVTDGIYTRTRNPVYLGFCLLLVGWAFDKDSAVFLVAALLLALALDRAVIRHEEAYLARTFREPYRAYRQRVRRWL